MNMHGTMKKHGVMLLALASLFSSGVQATLITYSATLSGAAENPSVPSPGTGSSLVTYDTDFHTLRVEIVFSDLTGTTTAAHIHCCVDAPGNVGVATEVPTFLGFPLGVTSGSYDRTFDLTQVSSFNPAFVTNNGGTVAGAEAALIGGLSAGRAYLNIHSTFRTGGEIRGFLAPVPEPATLSLFGLGFGALFAAKRKQGTQARV